jgi:hypothetical protein
MAKRKKRKYTPSAGGRRESKINSLILRLTMKVNRWERYREEIEGGKRSGDVKRWNTSGLKKHIQLLENSL